MEALEKDMEEAGVREREGWKGKVARGEGGREGGWEGGREIERAMKGMGRREGGREEGREGGRECRFFV
jgi:hypothetical protein